MKYKYMQYNMMNIYNTKDEGNQLMIFIPFFKNPLFDVVSMEIVYLGKFNFLLGKIEYWAVYRHCSFSSQKI